MDVKPPPESTADPDAVDWAAQFAHGLARAPWLNAYNELPTGVSSFACPSLTTDGEFPTELSGVLRRILAAKHEVFGVRYHHWWDGDGMLAEFAIRDGSVSHRAKYIETDKYRREQAAGRAIYEQFGTAAPGLARPDNIDHMNPANVNVLEHAGQLMALGDWCSAWRIDARSLEGLGRKVWSQSTAGAPFSAHPRIEADGTLWSIGYAPWQGRLYLYHIGPDGHLRKSTALEIPEFGLVHDFIITQRFLVIPLTSTVWSQERQAAGFSMLDCLVWKASVPLRVLVVDKNDFAVSRIYELPPGMIYHYGNGYQTDDGRIRFHCCLFADADYMLKTFREVMRGELSLGAPPLQMICELDPGGAARMIPIGGIGELPRVDERFMGQAFRHVWLGSPGGPPGPPSKFGFSALTRLDVESGATETYDFGSEVIVEEPAFAPRPGRTGEGDGWMVGTSYHIGKRQTVLSVFDAMHIADGPIANAYLPYAQPIGVHGNFYPSTS